MDGAGPQIKVEANRAASPRELRIVHQNRRFALLIPILVLELYLALTVFIFFFGPVDWHVPSPWKLTLFLLINYAGLGFGYAWGIKRGSRALIQGRVGEVGIIRIPPPVIKLLLWSMLFNIVSTMMRLQAIRGGFGEVMATLLNPGEAYRESQMLAQAYREGGSALESAFDYSWGFRISTVMAVFNGLYFPLGLICWHRLRPGYKALFLASLSCTIMYFVGVGAQSGIGNLLFVSLPVALYRAYVFAKPITADRMRILSARSKGWGGAVAKLLVVALACALAGTVVFFQIDRAESSGRELDLTQALGGGLGSLSETGIVPITDGKASYGFVMLCVYASHGYAGLALSMELPFEWTYGLGWSRALQTILHDYLGGPDLFDQTYLARNEEKSGWPALTWWSTIFPWIASDTTYFGTVFFMVMIGWVIGRCWMSVIITGNPIGFALLGQMFTLVFMIPANNALTQSLDGLFSLTGVLLIYGMSWKYVGR